jgi:acyl-CoA synthetase (AMP-forming)/AMP-acid ligase II
LSTPTLAQVTKVQNTIMLMSNESIFKKIDHARRTEMESPPLRYIDIPQMLNDSKSSTELFLTYINGEDNRVALTYKEFIHQVFLTANYLKNGGLIRGDRIATVSHNHWHTVVHYFASWLLGLVVVPINLSEDDNRIAYILEKSNVKLVFIRDLYEKRISHVLSENGLKDINLVLCTETLNDTIGSGNYVLDSLFSNESLAEEDALIVFTSGTTGNPKGVVLTQKNLLEDARAISDWHQIDSDTKMMCVLPIHHVNGTVVTLMTPFYAGGSVVLNEKFRVGKFFDIITSEQVHIVSVVPTLLQFLNNEYEGKAKPNYPTLRHIICGAGPLTVSVAQNFEERFGIRIIHGYGLSETTCYSCYLPLDISEAEHKKWMREYGYPSIGIALQVNEMAIHDNMGEPVPHGERGEIVIRGYNVMSGYYANESANEEAFTYGWFRSGDEGFIKKDQFGREFYFITGRLKELIIRGGVNLSPLEIDEVICRAPGVKVGISVGFENDWYGEEVGAYVQLLDGTDENEESILKFCSEHLPFSKCPKVIVFGNDIPVTSTGKYQRRKVAHLFKKWKQVQFRK